MSKATKKTLCIDDIRIDGGTQPRVEINDDMVSEYADAMRGGATFPPVVVFFDGVDYWLADGFHRWHASRRADLENIDAEVYAGGARDAILFSVSANAAHGQRRTNADKRKAVLTLLNDDEWAKWSDRVIAERCAVSNPFVSSIRAELLTVNSCNNRQTRGADGKTRRRPGREPAPEATQDVDEDDNDDEEDDEPQRPSAPRPVRLAMQYATMAISQLERIRDDDPDCDKALDRVQKWLNARRRK